MKFLFSILFLLSFSAWAKPVVDFNSVLMENVQKDIQKDEDKFKSKELSRGPASVGATEDDARVQEVPKLDKNLRQIGPNKW